MRTDTIARRIAIALFWFLTVGGYLAAWIFCIVNFWALPVLVGINFGFGFSWVGLVALGVGAYSSIDWIIHGSGSRTIYVRHKNGLLVRGTQYWPNSLEISQLDSTERIS